jgi:hypothetical protein
MLPGTRDNRLRPSGCRLLPCRPRDMAGGYPGHGGPVAAGFEEQLVPTGVLNSLTAAATSPPRAGVATGMLAGCRTTGATSEWRNRYTR